MHQLILFYSLFIGSILWNYLWFIHCAKFSIIISVIYIYWSMAFLIWIESFMKLPNALLSTKQINYEICSNYQLKEVVKFVILYVFQTLYICVVAVLVQHFVFNHSWWKVVVLFFWLLFVFWLGTRLVLFKLPIRVENMKIVKRTGFLSFAVAAVGRTVRGEPVI